MRYRIQKILQEEGMTAAKFADEIGIQASSISHFISGRNKPSTDILVKIIDRFRGLNAEWLLTGRGSMYKGDDEQNLQNTISSSREIHNSVPKVPENDLFSHPHINDFKPESKQDVSASIDKSVSNETPDETVESSKNRTDPNISKSINQIVIFYSDNSFDTYFPKK